MFHESYEVIVIGGGHAGCEAALAASRMGRRTLLLNLNVDNTALMPCNPSIGGPAKGHLVREISALGGEQARAADASTLMVRWLNTSKGVAVRALRAQCDLSAYAAFYLRALQRQENLDIHQDEAIELLLDGSRVSGIRTRHGSTYEARAVVLCSGVYGGGTAHVGNVSFPSGPMGQSPANAFFRYLSSLGLKTGLMRTDTSPRLNLDTIDLSETRKQCSENIPLAFDIWGEKRVYDTNYACYFSHTTPETHAILTANIHRSPLVTGEISALGPRYCPSIEDKFLRFPDRTVQPIVFEPLARSGGTKEVYIQNFSTSLPYDVQVELIRSLPGCKNAKIMKPGYGIEYVYLEPDQLSPTFESKMIKGFFCAGQVNGTSGYEEAAAQGLLAGINAALSVFSITGEEQIVLGRSDSYLGVLADDLTTKSTNEPYRMFTSRCEHRLLMRYDNADRRLSPIGRRVGLIDDARWEELTRRWELADAEIERLKSVRLAPSDEVNSVLSTAEAEPLTESTTLAAMLRRRNVTYGLIESLLPPEKKLGEDEAFHVETELRYVGYIEKEKRTASRMENMDNVLIPEQFDYGAVKGMRAESSQKLQRFRPRSLGQALRISGVTPADVQLLWVAIKLSRSERR